MFFLTTQTYGRATMTTARHYQLNGDGTFNMTYVKNLSRVNGDDIQAEYGPDVVDSDYVTREGHAFLNFGHDGTLHTL